MGIKAGIGLAAFGATAGAIGGGYVGSRTGEYGYENTKAGVATGAVVGGAALGVLGGSPLGVGKGMLKAGSAGLGGIAKVGGAALNLGGNVVDAVIKGIPGAAKTGAGLINGVGSVGTMASIGSPLRRHLGAVGGFAESLVRMDLPADTLRSTSKSLAGKKIVEGVKLTNPVSGFKAGVAGGKTVGGKIVGGVRGALVNGQSVLWGASLMSGVAKGFGEYNKSRMGQYDGQVTTSTPKVPNYQMDNGGADGDLVFALNNLRNGG